jgi:cytochrome P450
MSATTDDYDPFEAFNRAAGAADVADPYPQMAEQRAKGPVLKLELADMEGGSMMSMSGGGGGLPEGLNIYSALSFDAASEVLRDSKTYSSALYAAIMGPVMGKTILQMDEPEHSRVRKLLSTAFTRRALGRWEESLVRPVVRRFIDEFASTGKGELVRGLTFPFPVHVIAGLLGLPERDLPQFHRWAVELISVSVDQERALAASASLTDYFSGLLEERRKAPSDDMLSILARAELDGERLSDEDIFAFFKLLLPAGAETTYRSSSNLLVGLLTNPDQLDALRADRSLMDQAIEEGLRWEAPLLGIARVALAERAVCGVNIPAGSIVPVGLGSANRDDTRWDDPDDFDLFRAPKPHLAFAYGAHSCMGAHLARMETRVLLTELFDRLPNMRLDSDAAPPEIRGQVFRSPAAIHVAFDA